MSKPTMLSIVSEWWQWTEEDLVDIKAWAERDRESCVAWLRQEAEKALAQHEAGHHNVEDWLAYGRRKHA